MRKSLLFILVFGMLLALTGCMKNSGNEQSNVAPVQDDTMARQAVADVVKTFGQRLQLVSLTAPPALVQQSMQDNYSDLVSATLLEKWQGDPLNAPGRLVSSPWPDRIEVRNIERLSEDSYKVQGEILEIISVEQSIGGVAAQRAITLIIKKFDNKWLIDSVTLGQYTDNMSVYYNNAQYGFRFKLPKSWQNYSILTTTWEGIAVAGPQSGQVVQTGPIISIRHPQWTQAVPRQDIPIMVFTLSQWKSLQKEEFGVGAAPIPPSELGRNSRYVFTLPARYNYAFPAGFEEVETILDGIPLQPTEAFTQ